MDGRKKGDYNWMVKYLLPMLDIDRDSNPYLIRLLETRHTDEFYSALAAYQRDVSSQIIRITDEMPGGFFVYHADGNEELIYFNQAMLHIFGCETREEFCELTGNSFRGIVHPDDLDSVEESIVRQISVSSYDLDYVEYRIIRKDGEVRWLEDYGHFAHTETAGDIFYVFVADATEKREHSIQESLRQEQHWKEQLDQYSRELEVISREHLHRLEVIEALSIDYDSIFYVDTGTDRVYIYRLRRLFEGYRKQNNCVEDFRRLFLDFIESQVHPDDREMLIRELGDDTLREKLQKSGSFYVNFRNYENGEVCFRQIRVVNTRRSDGPLQIVMGFRSVDEEIRYEMEQKKVLEDALRQASSANIAKNTFLSNMSHDIRTPLNAIVGFTALARNHIYEQDALQRYLSKIEESSAQLLRLLSNVLEISRIEAGKVQVEEKPCDLREILRDVERILLRGVNANDQTLSVDMEKLIHHRIYSDEGKLKQIFAYLLGNASKFTEPGGSIRISVEEFPSTTQNYAAFRFVVEDTGIGISEEFLEHIFEPFERERNTTLSGIQGTGLGLTIIRSVVEMLGGTIEASSEVGQGSRFTVTLSFRLQMHANGSYDAGEDMRQGKSASKRRILVVEDNDINREIITELLQDAEFLVDTAENGREAVEKVRHAKPGDYALILMDIQMPVMNGYEASRTIRNLEDGRLANIPIIALSANAFEEDKKMSRACGMNAHVAKPVNVDDLLEVISEIARPL